MTVNIDDRLRADLEGKAREQNVSRSRVLELTLAQSFGREPPEYFVGAGAPNTSDDPTRRKPKPTEAAALFKEQPDDPGAI